MIVRRILASVCCGIAAALAGPPLEFEWIGGVAAEHRLTDKFILMGELRDIARSDFADHELFFNAGFKWKLHEQWTLLASAGCTLHEPRGERAAFLSYLGLQLIF